MSLAMFVQQFLSFLVHGSTYLSPSIFHHATGDFSTYFVNFFHALYVAKDLVVNQEPQPFFQALACFCVNSFGGGTLGAILLGQPAPWTGSDLVVAIYLAVFLFIYFQPTKKVFKLLSSQFAIKWLIDIVECVSLGSSISGGVERALAPLHQHPVKASTFAALFVGFLGGCGGGMTRATFSLHKRQWSFGVPRHFADPHFPFLISLVGSPFYYFLVAPLHHSHIASFYNDFIYNSTWFNTYCIASDASTTPDVITNTCQNIVQTFSLLFSNPTTLKYRARWALTIFIFVVTVLSSFSSIFAKTSSSSTPTVSKSTSTTTVATAASTTTASQSKKGKKEEKQPEKKQPVAEKEEPSESSSSSTPSQLTQRKKKNKKN